MLEFNIQLLVVYTNIQLAQEEIGTDFCINLDNNIIDCIILSSMVKLKYSFCSEKTGA